MRVLKMELNNIFCFKQNIIPPTGEFGDINCFIGENDRGKSLALKILDMIFNGMNSPVFEGIRMGGAIYDANLNPIGKKLIHGNSNLVSNITIYLELKDLSQFNNILDRLQPSLNDIKRYRNVKLEYKIEFPIEGDGKFILGNIFFGDEKNGYWIDIKQFGGFYDDFRNILFGLMSKNGYVLIPAIRYLNRELISDAIIQKTPSLDGKELANAIFQYSNNPRLDKRKVIGQLNNDLKILSKIEKVSSFTDQGIRDVEFDEIPESFIGDATKQITISMFNLIFMNEKKIIGYEEPESHLYPGKQKEYLKYLIQKLKNRNIQLFFTTHSPFLINMLELKNIYRFFKDEIGEIKIDTCTSDEDLWLLLSEIGVKPSDYLQSDLILFTEGPSDKKILEIFAEKLGYNLREYNVCLIHLGSISKDLDIETLLHINRNFKLIIDSNLNNIQGELVVDEIRELFKRNEKINNLKVWKRKEIENYLSPEKIEEYYKLPNNTIEIQSGTDVDDEINKKLNQNKINKKFKKTKDGPKIAQLMNKKEIDEEIRDFFEDVLKFLKSN